MFLRSPSFQKLLGLPEVGADFIRNIKQASSQIAGLLLGAPVFPDKAFLSLVINGPFDADKLDYMPRDCLMAGVPCAVDVNRLIEKVHCVRVPPEHRLDLMMNYRNWAGHQEGKDTWVLALPRSALSALNELAMTRTLLYGKVYFHQKARALELMVRRLLKAKPRSIAEWLALTDEGLLLGDEKAAQDLRLRRLLKRAFFFSSTHETQTEEKKKEDAKWRRFRRKLKNGKLEAELLIEAIQVAQFLGEDVEALQDSPPAIDEIPKSKLGLDQFAFIGDAFGDLDSANSALSSQRAEAAKLIACSGIHVFAPEKLQRSVFFAANKLFEDNGLPPQPNAFARTKLEPKELKDAQTLLISAGYLPPKTPAIEEQGIRSHQKRAVEGLLRAAWSRIEQLAINFGRYQSPNTLPVSTDSIAAFLRQFETEGCVRSALRMLERVDFKDRVFFAEAIEANIRAALEKGPIDYICPLGKSGDSSTLLSYFISDLPAKYQRPVMPLELALEKKPTNAILLWDDFCGAGGHAVTALSQWLGNDDISNTLNEDLADPLSQERKNILQNTTLYIGFAMARQSGLTHLSQSLLQLGLTRAKVLQPHKEISAKDFLFSEQESIFPDPSEREELKGFLEKTARRILKPRTTRQDKPWTEEKLTERLLGYGNTAHLLVFYYNVPTITLTPLWSGEEHEGGWKPLFARRGKPPKVHS